MFYSHVYLRKNGRFGFIWLAATQTKVLTRRELAAVNIAMTASDILEHIPGQMVQGVYNRSRRFSLYLSSQLMFGTVKVLQKQWDFLLSDITALLRRFHPDVPTKEIDLIIVRQEPVTLESCVPTSIKDKCYDPTFGIFERNVTDVEALLAAWDRDNVSKHEMGIDWSTVTVKAEIGSPNSVSDARQIQIQDHPEISISSVIPDEQDLPLLNAEDLALIQSADQDLHISAEELLTHGVFRILTDTNNVSVLPDHVPMESRPIEETPAVKISKDLPQTPQKPKKRKQDSDGGQRKPRQLDAKDKEDTHEPRCGQDFLQAPDMLPDQQPIEVTNVLQDQHEQQRETTNTSVCGLQLSPDPARQSSQDWLRANPGLQLTPIPTGPSPLRKRLPHKLIIDETLQLTRLELKQNMTTSSDTTLPLVLPTAHKKDLFKEPGSHAVNQTKYQSLWTRNCKFGLRVSEHKKGLSKAFPLEPPSLKGRGSRVDYETPAKLSRADSMMSGPASIERGRDASLISAPNESRDRSRSLVGPASDDSAANISADQHQLSRFDQDQSVPGLSLAPWPEEQEQITSPQPLHIPAEVPPMNMSVDQVPSETSRSSSQNELFSLVQENVSQEQNWTTFRTICPPTTCTKNQAIHLFQELCIQVGSGSLRVLQKEPYGEIYIWAVEEILQ